MVYLETRIDQGEANEQVIIPRSVLCFKIKAIFITQNGNKKIDTFVLSSPAPSFTDHN